MPVQVSYPGVYVEELPSSEKTPTSVSTSTAAFVDYFVRGPMDEAVKIFNYRDFQRIYGGLDQASEASYGVMQFFNNGGQTAYVVRAGDGRAEAAEVKVEVTVPTLEQLAQEALEASFEATEAARGARFAAAEAARAFDGASPPEDSSLDDLVVASPPSDIVDYASAKKEYLKTEFEGPELAQATEVAALAAEVAAEKTQRAAEAATAASKVLAERLLQEQATGGAIGAAARDAAQEAADAAKVAAEKAGEASGAAEAARDAKPAEDVEGEKKFAAMKDAITKAAQTAEEAAEAALEVADKAGAAQEAAADVADASGGPGLKIAAANPGVWGNRLRALVMNRTEYRFDLVIQETAIVDGRTRVTDVETYHGLTIQDQADSSFAPALVTHESRLVDVIYDGPAVKGARPDGEPPQDGEIPSALFEKLGGGTDGGPPDAAGLISKMRAALEEINPDVFNILCLPITATYPAGEAKTAITEAMGFCKEKRGFMIVDIPASISSVDNMKRWMKSYGNADNFAGATYFPRLIMPDPLQNYRPRNVAPSGTIAGIYARTDSARGIWKAPAGTEAVLQGVDVAAKLNDNQDGELNPLGVNCLRTFPVYGNICWGARTLAGADQLSSQWKYIPIRRLFYFLQESIFQSMKWAVFEPNDEQLWGKIRQQVGSFLQGLFTNGAFAGGTPDKAYFVHCDAATTTPADINRGIVNVVIGVAPLKPAEFIILQFEQIAGQA